jgi:hypothetical protein
MLDLDSGMIAPLARLDALCLNELVALLGL